MTNAKTILRELIEMSREIGRPERDLVILGEGNTSAACDDGTFWVKASGTQLRTPDADTFVQLWLKPVCELADQLHALALTEMGAAFVGHTHPVAINALMCSVAAEDACKGCLFPDGIVVCGPAPAYVPYTDPGLPLARAVRNAVRRYMDTWSAPPKVILMQNHGLIALGSSPTEVDGITSMAVKASRILAGTYAFGGPHFMSESDVERIYTRPDESYRRKELKLD